MKRLSTGERYADRLARIRREESVRNQNLSAFASAGIDPRAVARDFGVAGSCGDDSSTWIWGPGSGRADCCPAKPPICDCHLLGANTLAAAAAGDGTIAAGGTGTVTVDSGDAGYFIPYYMSVVAFESVAFNDVDPTDQLLVLLIQSRSGQVANMRRQSATDPSFGVHMLVYGQRKEVECVDWHPFSSTNNQQLIMTFFNPTALAAHVFVNIWGLPLRKVGT